MKYGIEGTSVVGDCIDSIKLLHSDESMDLRIKENWNRNRKELSVNYIKFKDKVLSLGFEKEWLLYGKEAKIAKKRYGEKLSLGNILIRIPLNLTLKDKQRIKRNYNLVGFNISLTELYIFANNSSEYHSIKFPFITKDFGIIDVDEVDVNDIDKDSLRGFHHYVKESEAYEIFKSEFLLKYKSKINEVYLDKYIIFCINNDEISPKGVEYEVHHILPRATFKEYENLKQHPWNVSTLTKENHLEAHRLLSLAFDMKSAKQSYAFMSSVKGRYLDKLGRDKIKDKEIIIFTRDGLEIERFNSLELAEKKWGTLWSNLLMRDNFFNKRNPKIALINDDLLQENLKICIDKIKSFQINVYHLKSEMEEEFESEQLFLEKYSYLDFSTKTFDKKTKVVYKPNNEEHNDRKQDAISDYNNSLFYIEDLKTKKVEEFSSPLIAMEKYPSLNQRGITFDEASKVAYKLNEQESKRKEAYKKYNQEKVLVMDLNTEEVEEFPSLAKTKLKYPSLLNLQNLTFDNGTKVAWRPHLKEQKTRKNEALKKYKEEIVIVYNLETDESKQFLTRALAKKEFPKLTL